MLVFALVFMLGGLRWLFMLWLCEVCSVVGGLSLAVFAVLDVLF